LQLDLAYVTDYQLGYVVDGMNDDRKEFDASTDIGDVIQQCYDYCVSIGCKQYDVIDKPQLKFCYFSLAEVTSDQLKADDTAGAFFMEACVGQYRIASLAAKGTRMKPTNPP
jgi:hypothetical protein